MTRKKSTQQSVNQKNMTIDKPLKNQGPLLADIACGIDPIANARLYLSELDAELSNRFEQDLKGELPCLGTETFVELIENFQPLFYHLTIFYVFSPICSKCFSVELSL